MSAVNYRGAMLVPAWQLEDEAFSDFKNEVESSQWTSLYRSHSPSGNVTGTAIVTATVSTGDGDTGAVVVFSSLDSNFAGQSLNMNQGDYLLFYSGGDMLSVSVVREEDFNSEYVVISSDN